MTITVESIIRAGALAQKEYNLREGYEIRIFPSNCPEVVEVWETPKPIAVTEDYFKDPPPYVLPPRKDLVSLRLYGTDYNMDSIRMGYSRGLNILCLSLT